MGIQINGTNDTINAADGSFTLVGASFVDPTSLSVSGVGTFQELVVNGNASIGGTITYMDVTNIDSVGIITAQQGIQVLANGINVTGVSTFTGDLIVGVSTFFVDVSTGQVLIGTASINGNQNDADLLVQGNSTQGELYLSRGSTPLNNGGGLGFINFTGGNGEDAATIRSYSDGGTWTNGSSHPSRIVFATAADGESFPTERLRITSTGDVVLGQGSTVGSSVGVVTYYGDGSQLSGISVGLTTESASPNNTITHLDLTNAQDHKLIVSGITTISVTGGTEADSHTIRIVNSGIATVGFSTYFLFPSGATPSLPTADGAISLISFSVHRVGLGGTQLLAGASVNFS